jgi:hypothetical protein
MGRSYAVEVVFIISIADEVEVVWVPSEPVDFQAAIDLGISPSMKYQLRKPETVEALTFDEFVEFGKSAGANIVNGMPWSFTYAGRPVTHENDRCYLIVINQFIDARFTPDDVLVLFPDGRLEVFTKEGFHKLYEVAP